MRRLIYTPIIISCPSHNILAEWIYYSLGDILSYDTTVVCYGYTCSNRNNDVIGTCIIYILHDNITHKSYSIYSVEISEQYNNRIRYHDALKKYCIMVANRASSERWRILPKIGMRVHDVYGYVIWDNF